MKIVYLSPGAGNMYCGNCLRDNALAAELHRQGHDVCTIPLYLPPSLDDPDESQNTPIFFGGVSVYLEQKLPFFRYAPKFIHHWLANRKFLKIIGSRAASTQPAQVGDLTVSMLNGEHGNQRRELDELCRFLKTEQPEAVVFSNALLLGMHGQIKSRTGAKTICLLSGEDSFLDHLSEPFQTQAWELVKKHAAEVDVLTAPSNFYAGFMSQRLGLLQNNVKILPPGINLEGYAQESPTVVCGNKLGFFARMTYSKGLDTFVDAYIEVRNRNHFPNLTLKIGGSTSKHHLSFLQEIEDKLGESAFIQDAKAFPDLNREDKIKFLQSLTLFSVPSRLNEPFGLFVLEAFAAGVPALFPNRGAFPEIAEQSGACILFEPENPSDLADRIEELLSSEERRKEMSANARRAVSERWNITGTAKRLIDFTR